MLELKHAISITAVGSRVTCVPAPTDTDRDWLVMVEPGKAIDFDLALIGAGWEMGGSDIPESSNLTPECDRFHSFTKTVDGVTENIIATSSQPFHERFLAATSVAKRLNLLSKNDRIALFQAVLYGNGDISQGWPSTHYFSMRALPAPAEAIF